MKYSQPNARVIAAVEGLEYDFKQFVLKDFAQYIANRRGKPILLYVYPLDKNVFGVWLPKQTVDYVIISKTVHPTHKVHIILHELAHIVLNHPRHSVADILPSELLRELNGDETQAEGCARYVAQRINTLEEQEAEDFVFYIQDQVFKHRRLQELTVTGSSIENLLPLLQITAY